MKKKRDLSVFSLSFLDCICCGFGAIILLFVLTMGSTQQTIENTKKGLSATLEKELESLQGILAQREDLSAELAARNKALSSARADKDDLETQLAELEKQIAESQGAKANLVTEIAKVEDEIAARQKEIDLPQKDPRLPVGVPVDSNHLIFIIDTSGSMRHPLTGSILPEVIEKIEETLEVYPIVEGIQVLDASGNYILRNTKGKWLPDNPQTRRKIAEGIRRYAFPSVSNPVPGIVKSIQTFNDPDNPNLKIGIYVFGDEFTGTADSVIQRIDNLNPPDKDGKRSVTINAIGFPNLINTRFGVGQTGLKFANLMRELTYRNNGAFIAIEK